ncbi:hypothetical protein [Burkholderia vietnamiensis]|uniref:hypothetical protein n=1 Tax=Burkholderia vietnamiensis TaxID=60552 RepID=UPI000B0A57D6|nr:hypothetical protein [Burkholderia vietnamiensis]
MNNADDMFLAHIPLCAPRPDMKGAAKAMKETIDTNVTLLPVKPRNELGHERVLQTVLTHKCWHRRFIVDEQAEKVLCADCKEPLNPMWVLVQLSNQETRYHALHDRYQDELKRLKERSRTKCRHCGNMTPISKS